MQKSNVTDWQRSAIHLELEVFRRWKDWDGS